MSARFIDNFIHASVELIDAIRGDGGIVVTDSYRIWACTGKHREDHEGRASLVYAWVGPTIHKEDEQPVTCPRCLRLMDEARGPVRQDELEIHRLGLEQRAVEAALNAEREHEEIWRGWRRIVADLNGHPGGAA